MFAFCFKKTTRYFLLLFYGVNFSLSAQCPGNLLINGSFNATKGEGVVAPGWAGSDTPDTNDNNGVVNTSAGYSWTGTPLASPDGGTWQNLYGPEYIQQSIVVIPGQLYQFCLQYAAQGITLNGILTFTAATGVSVSFNNTPVFSTPLDMTLFTWESACFTFSSQTSPVSVSLKSSVYDSYLAIDGACIQPDFIVSGLEVVDADAGFQQSYAGDRFNVTVPGAAEIRMYDISSQPVLQQPFTGSFTFNTEQLPQGIYLYEVLLKNGQIRKGKLVKQ